MTESFTTVITRNSDSHRTICHFPLLTWFKVRQVLIKTSLGLFHLCKFYWKLDCQRVCVNSVVSIANFSKECFYYAQALLVPFRVLEITLKTTTTKTKNQLTLGNLTNISVQVSPTCTINTTKHAPLAIIVKLVHESRVVFTTWLPFSPFTNSQRSSIHPGPIPGPLC